jgi:hypothetical protein
MQKIAEAQALDAGESVRKPCILSKIGLAVKSALEQSR